MQAAKDQMLSDERNRQVQREMAIHQQQVDAWSRYSVEATLFERLYSEVAKADDEFIRQYLIVSPCPFPDLVYEDECDYMTDKQEAESVDISGLNSLPAYCPAWTCSVSTLPRR
jgi:hypothetical protein